MNGPVTEKSPIRVLYVEDDRGLARLLQGHLQRRGYAVEIASGGREGLSMAENGGYDMAIVDYRMPDMDGLQMLDSLTRQGIKVPSIMVTGAGDERVAVEAMKRGAEDYIVKDVDGSYLDLLPSVIDRVLAKQRLLGEKHRIEDALLRSEQRYSSLVEHAPYAIVVVGDRHLAFGNAAAVRLFGARVAVDLVARPLDDFIAPERVPPLMEALTRGRDEGSEPDRLEERLTRLDGTVIDVEISGTVVTYRKMPAVQLFIRDITEEKRARKERQEHARKLKDALVQTIQVVALTIEKRDPFTAGHQRRVAHLARAIALAMGWDENRIDGLHMGALIHDIGKIYVPTAILNRPGQLSKVECDLVRTHAEVGYDIIKDVNLPWPVADMVRQHHERVDGSGYPLGLGGEATLPEARIIAVADVVEAMASHRPYRPSRGIEEALEEIERGAGTAYDPEAVAACIRLFKEDGNQFE